MVLVYVWLFILALLAYLVWKNADGIANLWAATTNYVTASWNDFYDGMTAYGLVAVILGGLFGGAVGLLIGWLRGRGLAEIEVNRAKAKTVAAQREAADDRQTRLHAEQQAAAAQGRERDAAGRQAEAERRAQGLQGQLEKAVMLADRRGRANRELRQKMRDLKARLPEARDGAIVEPLKHAERHGSSSKRGPRTGP